MKLKDVSYLLCCEQSNTSRLNVTFFLPSYTIKFESGLIR